MNMFRYGMSIFLFGLSAMLPAQVERKEVGNLVLENVPEIPQRVVERMFQYGNTRSASIADWHPSGKGMLIHTRFGETQQVHFVEKPGGARRQITFFEEPVNNLNMCPSESFNGFFFSKDLGGNEMYQIFSYELDSGKFTMLSDGKSRHTTPTWSNRGDQFAFSSTARNGRDYDIHLGKIGEPGNFKSLIAKGGAWFTGDFSPDDSKLLVARYVSANESYGYVLDLKSGELMEMNRSEEKVALGEAAWVRGGKGLLISSDDGSEFQTLRYMELATGKTTELTAEIPWDVDQLSVSRDGRHIAFVVNEDGISKLYLMNPETFKYQAVAGIPVGQVYRLRFHPKEPKLAMVINTPQTPGDVFVLDLKTRALERWTYSEVGGLDTSKFVVPELIHFDTFDQVDGKPRKIPAFYYRPHGKGPFPVMIDIHGGPEGQEVPLFHSMTQYFVNEIGIAVIAPNVRGSTGYGKSYLQLDNGFLREDSVKDIGKLLDWIGAQSELDAARTGVMGGSYGGYMVLASMVHYNDRLKCGIDIVGISNFVTFLENTQAYRRDLRRVEYGDERDPKMREFLLAISPTNHAAKITKPMFIVQGLNDPRVPASEAEQIVKAMRENGGNAWYLLAKDEGHGFQKKGNRDLFNQATVLFLENNLLK